MSPVIALLRAVNVGGRTVTSAQLREVAESLGHTQVTTYVNSGNIVLVPAGAVSAVGPGLAEALVAELGFDVPVVTRSLAQWDAIVERLPYPDEASSDPSHLVLYCWDGAPGGAPTSTRRRTAARPSRSPATRPTRTSPTASAAPSSPSPCWRRPTGRVGDRAQLEHRARAAAARPRARLTSVAS